MFQENAYQFSYLQRVLLVKGERKLLPTFACNKKCQHTWIAPISQASSFSLSAVAAVLQPTQPCKYLLQPAAELPKPASFSGQPEGPEPGWDQIKVYDWLHMIRQIFISIFRQQQKVHPIRQRFQQT
jgi:hypothetical protein